eukprot:1140327-Pelagomonas_calceolata.AAC.2
MPGVERRACGGRCWPWPYRGNPFAGGLVQLSLLIQGLRCCVQIGLRPSTQQNVTGLKRKTEVTGLKCIAETGICKVCCFKVLLASHLPQDGARLGRITSVTTTPEGRNFALGYIRCKSSGKQVDVEGEAFAQPREFQCFMRL